MHSKHGRTTPHRDRSRKIVVSLSHLCTLFFHRASATYSNNSPGTKIKRICFKNGTRLLHFVSDAPTGLSSSATRAKFVEVVVPTTKSEAQIMSSNLWPLSLCMHVQWGKLCSTVPWQSYQSVLLRQMYDTCLPPQADRQNVTAKRKATMSAARPHCDPHLRIMEQPSVFTSHEHLESSMQ